MHWWGAIDEAEQDRLACDLRAVGTALYERGSEDAAIDGVRGYAYEAARARASRMFERLLEFEYFEDQDRQELRAYADAVARGAASARLWRGAPSLAGWLQRERDYSARQYERFKRNYQRFARHADVQRALSPRASLPVWLLVPAWARERWSAWRRTLAHLAPRLAVSAAVAIALAADTRTSEDDALISFFRADLGDGPRLVMGDVRGRWWIARPDGSIEWRAPESLALPRYLSGGTAGDLTGDGKPELVVYDAEEFDQSAYNGEPLRWVDAIDVLTRDGGGGWRRLSRLPSHPGTLDDAHCRRTLDELLRVRARHAPIEEPLRRARERCPSVVGDILVERGLLHVFTRSYARQHLVARCDASGCGELVQALAYDADATSAVRAPDGSLLVGTACWRDPLDGGGPYAYGLLHEDFDGRRGRVRSFLPLEGCTRVAPFESHALLALTGPPCPGDASSPAMVAAAADMVTAPPRCMLRVFDLGLDGALALREAVSLDNVCPPASGAEFGGSTVLPAHEGGGDVIVVVLDGEEIGTQILLFDATRPLGAQSPTPTRVSWRSSVVSVVDVDDDGDDEVIVVTARSATRRVLHVRGQRDAAVLAE